jgi:hypothetical protein
MSRRALLLRCKHNNQTFIRRCPTCHQHFASTPDFAIHVMSDVHDSPPP